MSVAWGSRVCRIVALGHVGQPASAEGPPGALSVAGHGVDWMELEMDVLVERVARLDVAKAVVVVCVRTTGPDGRRVSETRTFRRSAGRWW